MSLTDATYIRGPPNQIVPDGGRGKAFLSAPRQGARVAFGDEHAAGWQGEEHAELSTQANQAVVYVSVY